MKGRTYRYFSGESLYPFGYGLSYATFAFNNLRFAKDVLSANDDLGASVAVTDTGKTAGDVIVQMYLSRPGVDGASVRSLVGRQRLSLNPGENKTVSIQVPNRNLSLVIPDGTRKTVPGKLQIWVGEGSACRSRGLAKVAGLLDRSPSRAVGSS